MATSLKQFGRKFNHLLVTRFRIIATILVIIIATVGYFLLLDPKISEIRKVGVFNLQRTKDKLAIDQEILDTTKQLQQKYDELNLANVEKLKAMLPKGQDLPNMFVEIESIALASGLKLDSVGFTEIGTTVHAGTTAASEAAAAAGTATPPTTKTAAGANDVGIRKLVVNFSVSGGSGYPDLKRFLSNVETSIRLLDIQSVTYAPGAQEHYQFNAITYSLP